MDDDIVIETGIPTQPSNHMRVGRTDDKTTTLQFIYRWKADDGKYHGQIGASVYLDNRNLPGLVELLTGRLKAINNEQSTETK